MGDSTIKRGKRAKQRNRLRGKIIRKGREEAATRRSFIHAERKQSVAISGRWLLE